MYIISYKNAFEYSLLYQLLNLYSWNKPKMCTEVVSGHRTGTHSAAVLPHACSFSQEFPTYSVMKNNNLTRYIVKYDIILKTT